MRVGLTGQSTTSSVGSATINDMTIGLSGQEFTLSQGTVTIPNTVAQLSGLAITSAPQPKHLSLIHI